MIDDQFDEQLRDAVRDYHRPPETPRDAIWARIEAARQEQQAPVVPIRRLPRRLAWGVGIAATLAIGVAIGRYSVARTPAGEPQVASGTTAPVESTTRPKAVTNSTREPVGAP